MAVAPASFDLTGRVALVTGSTRGIGRAIALGLAGQGATVAIHGPAHDAEASETLRAITAAGGRAAVCAADLADASACSRLVEDVTAALGPPDILVLNASIEIRQDWRAIDAASFDAQIAVNLRATLLLLQAAVPGMMERGWGRIVTLGSIQETKPNPALMIYAALKSAQTSMTRNLAKQVAAHGVMINNLAPGAIATDRNATVLADEAYRARVEGQIPVGKVGVPDDCVGACLLLCSDAGRYITGATIPVDGGWSAS